MSLSLRIVILCQSGTRLAGNCIPILLATCEGLSNRELEKQGCVCVCCAQLCLSVLTCFSGRGALSCHVYLRPAQNVPYLRE